MSETVTSAAPQSRVGKVPVPVPKGTNVTIAPGRCDVKGPKGTLSLPLPASVEVKQDGEVLVVHSSAAPHDAPRLQGLARALLANVVRGCSEGFERTLELVGVGYRAEMKGAEMHLQLGLSHTVKYPVPKGVAVNIPGDSKGTVIHLSSVDKSLLGQVAAVIRSFRPPEPYGGKGVRYRGEHIRRKAGKAGKK
jgi:large subunit ribosomal protein L6